MILTEIFGELIASIAYSNENDGAAIKTRTAVGM
jgi:hypothetical protein